MGRLRTSRGTLSPVSPLQTLNKKNIRFYLVFPDQQALLQLRSRPNIFKTNWQKISRVRSSGTYPPGRLAVVDEQFVETG